MFCNKKTVVCGASVCVGVLVVSALAGCNNGEAITAGFSPSDERTLTRGAIASVDPLTVNSRTYSIANANILHDRQAIDKTGLRTGMQATIESVSGSASLVHYEEDVKGPVDMVFADNTLLVMGQTVILPSDTLFETFGVGSFIAGDIVEVSGVRDANGSIQATFIEGKNGPQDSYKVRGTISQLSVPNQSFMIGSLQIDFSAARFDDFSQNTLANGDFLEVKDEVGRYEPSSLYLQATTIERYSGVFDTPGQVYQTSQQTERSMQTEIEIEAYITSLLSDNRFLLGSTSVRITPSTRFRDGDRQQLQVNSRVEVEGRLNAEGELVAWEIEFDDDSEYYDSKDPELSGVDDSDSDEESRSEVEIEGIVTNVNTQSGRFEINGILIQVGNSTEFEDRMDRKISRAQFFSLLVEGVSVVSVKWRAFAGYSGIPHEVEIED